MNCFLRFTWEANHYLVLNASFPPLTPGTISSGTSICMKKLEGCGCHSWMTTLAERMGEGCEWSQGQDCKEEWEASEEIWVPIQNWQRSMGTCLFQWPWFQKTDWYQSEKFARVMNLARTGLRQGCCQGRNDVIMKKLATDKWFFIKWLRQQLHALCFPTVEHANHVVAFALLKTLQESEGDSHHIHIAAQWRY